MASVATCVAAPGQVQPDAPIVSEVNAVAPERSPIPSSIVDSDLIPSIASKRPGKVEIQGLKAVTEDDARGMIHIQIRKLEENGVTMARADDAAFFLAEGIRNLGFNSVKVDWQITPGNDVVLTIDEGTLFHFAEINVSGNEHLTDAAVAELLTKVTRERLGYRIGAPNIPFVADDVDSGVAAVLHIYKLLGYADATVELDDTTFRSDESLVDVTISVTEGAVSKLGGIEFPPPVDDGISEVYAAIETEFSEKPYTPAVAANLADRITSAANEIGYYDASVEVDPSEPRPVAASDAGQSELRVDLVVKADWGGLYTVRAIKVTGIEKIKDGVVDRRFHRLVGDPYSPMKVSKVVEDLLETGAFDGLLVEPAPQPDHTIALEVEVEEAKRRSLGVYVGFGTYEGAILGLEFRNSNFLSVLNTYVAELEYTSRGLRGEINYTNRWLLGSPWELQLGVYSLTQQNEGYDILDGGFQIGLQRQFGAEKHHRVTFFAKPSFNNITDFEIEERFIGPENYFTSRAGVLYSYNKRDSPDSAQKGLSADLLLSGASSAIGSEIGFGRAAGRLMYSLPFDKTTLRLSARAGIIKPTGGDELPIDLRYFSGGPRSVRSFTERDLGPHDRGGYPIGGEFTTTFNAEYEIPVAGPFSIAPFFDAGNLIPDAEDASLDNMHYAAGLGFVLNSPIGPLRLDYGHNLNRGEREPTGSWHVGFGFAF